MGPHAQSFGGREGRGESSVVGPGEYQFRSGMNVLSAMAMAGGPTFRASRSSVLIQRAGTTELREYPLDATVGILPGDLVRIPERYF